MEYKKLRIIISGGGTGGHIFPAISIANKLKELNPESEILFVGAEGKMEMEKVPAAGYKIVGLPIVGLQRQLNLKNLVNDIQVPFKVLSSVRKAGKIIPIDTRDICRALDPEVKFMSWEAHPASLEAWSQRRGTLAADEEERHLGLDDTELMFRTVLAELKERNLLKTK